MKRQCHCRTAGNSSGECQRYPPSLQLHLPLLHSRVESHAVPHLQRGVIGGSVSTGNDSGSMTARSHGSLMTDWAVLAHTSHCWESPLVGRACSYFNGLKLACRSSSHPIEHQCTCHRSMTGLHSQQSSCEGGRIGLSRGSATVAPTSIYCFRDGEAFAEAKGSLTCWAEALSPGTGGASRAPLAASPAVEVVRQDIHALIGAECSACTNLSSSARHVWKARGRVGLGRAWLMFDAIGLEAVEARSCAKGC